MTRSLRRWPWVAAMVLAVAIGAHAGDIPANERRSDYDLMGPELRRMQDDDSANPGMLWVLDGEALWRRKEGSTGKSCADCHGEAGLSMKGVAARYPAFDRTLGRPIELEGRINACRTRHQGAEPLAFESKELLSLTAYVARQSKGLPISIADDAATHPFIAAGRTIFEQRQGPAQPFLRVCAMTTIGAGNWPVQRSRRPTRRATRFIGSNGKASAHCSGGCAIV